MDIADIKNDLSRPAGGIGLPRTLGRLVAEKNIHTDTLLATDYLNHFNEIVMLLELVADMPDCLEDALDWSPKPYEQHFADSSFQNKELAILAYKNAPRRYREPFDDMIVQMNETVLAALRKLQTAATNEDMDAIKIITSEVTASMQRYVDFASAIIHGHTETSMQAEIDALIATEETVPDAIPSADAAAAAAPAPVPEEDGDAISQDDIDALFD